MPFFDIFASPRSPLRMRTKVVSFFIFFQELSNQKKIKALRPKMTKIALRGGGSCLKNSTVNYTANLGCNIREVWAMVTSEGWTELSIWVVIKNAPYACGNFHACAFTRFQKPQQLGRARIAERARRSSRAQRGGPNLSGQLCCKLRLKLLLVLAKKT